MRWPVSLLIGLITAIVTAVAGAFAADRGMGWHGVSDFEGQRGMTMVFVFVPLCLVVGMVTGTWVARSGPPVGFVDGLSRLGLSLAISLGLVVATLGVAWVSADHAPSIDGKPLTLQWEMRLPPGYPVRDSLEANEFRVGLVASSSDRAFTTVDFAGVTRDGDTIVVRGEGPINSTGMRSLSANHGAFGANQPSQFVELPLRPSPRREDMEWSEWLEMRRYMDLSEVPAAERVRVRYRVQLAR